jgi:acetolactate synthase-1/3 small subunit
MITTLVLQVENKPGILNRVASLFRRRGFNIESLSVGHTEKAGVSRMTIVVDADEDGALRLEANLYKLVNVLCVENVTSTPAVFRDLAMIKVATTPETRAELMQLAHVFRARILDVAGDSMVLEATGAEDKINGLIEVLCGYGILEIARTGRVAMARGTRTDAQIPVRSHAVAAGDENLSYSV